MAVFYSFHYDRDAWRVQQIINMGAIEGQTILNSQEWEKVRRRGDEGIQEWIDSQMLYKSAVVVLIGAETATRRWVKYEIGKAWNAKRPLVGIRIHGLADRNGNTDYKGKDPFVQVALQGGGTVADFVPVYDPVGVNSQQVYASIKANLKRWVENAVKRS